MADRIATHFLLCVVMTDVIAQWQMEWPLQGVSAFLLVGVVVQPFVLHLERALKTIKQQHPYAMTEEEGHRHLKDHLFHGLKPNLHNAICYLHDKPKSQYSQLVMALGKAGTRDTQK